MNLHLTLPGAALAVSAILFGSCGGDTPDASIFNKTSVEKAIAQADTLPAPEAYQVALQLGGPQEQDSFYVALFEQKAAAGNTEAIRDNMVFYEKLRGGNAGPDIWLARMNGAADFNDNKLPEAIAWQEKGLALATEAGDTASMIACLKEVAVCESRRGEYEAANEAGIQALAWTETTGSPGNVAELRLDLAFYLFSSKGYDKAADMAQPALPIFQEVGNKEQEANTYALLGLIAEFQYDSAATVHYYEKTLEIREELQIPEALVESYGQYANFWIKEKDFAKAKKAAAQAGAWLKKSQIKGFEGQLAWLEGSAMMYTGEFEAGKEKLLFALEQAKAGERQWDECAAYQALYETHKYASRHAESLGYYEKYNEVYDEIFAAEKERNINELHIKYETAQKEKQLAELEHQGKVAQLRATVISLALLLALGLTLALFLRHRGQRRIFYQKYQLLEQEKELAKAREILRGQQLEQSQLQLGKTQQELEQAAKALQLKNELVEELQMRLHNSQSTSHGGRAVQLHEMKILNEEQWVFFQKRFEERFPGLQREVRDNFPRLTTAETRLFLLMKLKFDAQEIADTLGISKESVWRSRHRLSKKLGLEMTADLDAFVENYGQAEGQKVDNF